MSKFNQGLKKSGIVRLLGNAGVYMGTGMVGPMLGFLVIPVFTRYLTPEDFGIFSMFRVLAGIMMIFAGLNSHGAIARKYVDRDDGVNFGRYLGNGFILLIISAFFLSIGCWLFRGIIGEITLFPTEWLWVVVIYAVSQHIIMMVLVLFQMQERPITFAVIKLFSTVLPVVLSVLLVICFRMDWRGRLFSHIVVGVLSAVWVVVGLCRVGAIELKYHNDYMRHILRFGVPLIPHALGMYAISMTDRVLITNMVGLSETGIYAVGAQVGMAMGIIQDGFNRAWVPIVYRKLKRGIDAEIRKLGRYIFFYDLALLLIAVVGGILAVPVMKLALGEQFADSGKFVVWIMVGYAFNGMYKMSTNFLMYNERTGALACMTAATAILNVVFSYGLILLNGSVGAAQGTMLAFFISFVMTTIFSVKKCGMPGRI